MLRSWAGMKRRRFYQPCAYLSFWRSSRKLYACVSIVFLRQVCWHLDGLVVRACWGYHHIWAGKGCNLAGYVVLRVPGYRNLAPRWWVMIQEFRNTNQMYQPWYHRALSTSSTIHSPHPLSNNLKVMSSEGPMKLARSCSDIISLKICMVFRELFSRDPSILKR